MRIDVQKSARLVAVLALAAGACGPIRSPESTPTPVTDCRGIAAELFKPPGLDRESVLTYPGGIVVNQAGSIADISINIPNLTRLNTDPTLGLAPAGNIHIIYFFAGSFSRPDANDQVNAFFESQRPYLLARFCQEQGVSTGNYIVTTLSVIDAWNEVSNANPTLVPASLPWISALEREIAENYIRGTRIIVDSNLGRSSTQLPSGAVERALAGGLPFKIAKINQPPSNSI